MSPLESLIASGTKLWLDSVDPELIKTNKALGATGATSNPVIISDLIKTGRFDELITSWIARGDQDEEIAWNLADHLVSAAQAEFHSVWENTQGNDGYVSFEVDPLIEDPDAGLPHDARVKRYIELGTHWARGQQNRMIKVPATPAGLEALEELAASGVTLNVTLIFSDRQYRAARDAIHRGVQRAGIDRFKSVYSIFISRIDVYSQKHASELSKAAQGLVGIVNAKRIWKENNAYWNDHAPALHQEIVFASTGTKDPQLPAWYYLEALAGSDIQTNPPATNEATEESDMTFARQVDQLPSDEILAEIDARVDFQDLEDTLMKEGIDKFAKPQQKLLELIADKREQLVS